MWTRLCELTKEKKMVVKHKNLTDNHFYSLVASVVLLHPVFICMATDTIFTFKETIFFLSYRVYPR